MTATVLGFAPRVIVRATPRTRPDYRDLVAEDLANMLSEQTGIALQLYLESESYRQLSQQALAKIREMELTIRKQRATIESLRDELRRYIAATVQSKRGAAS